MGEVALKDPAQAEVPEAPQNVQKEQPPEPIQDKPEWMQETVDMIQESVPPRAAWRVIERCIARATSRYRVSLVGKEDQRGPRVVHPSKWDPVPEKFPGEHSEDPLPPENNPPSEAQSVPEEVGEIREIKEVAEGPEPAEREEIKEVREGGEVSEGLPGGAGEDKIHGLSSQTLERIAAMKALVELRKTLLRAPIEEGSGEAVGRILLDRRRLVYPHLKGMALQLDAEFIGELGGGKSKELDSEYKVAKSFTAKGMGLALLLDRYLGKRVLDISVTLLLRVAREYENWAEGGTKDDPVVDIPSVSDAKKEELMRDTVRGEAEKAFETGGRKKILQWILGEKHFKKLWRTSGRNYQRLMDHLYKVFCRSSKVREALMQKFQSWLHTPEKLLLAASVRQGWQELLSAQEVTDHEYWTGLNDEKRREVIRLETRTFTLEIKKKELASLSELVVEGASPSTGEYVEGRKAGVEQEIHVLEAKIKDDEEELKLWRERTEQYFKEHPKDREAQTIAELVDHSKFRTNLHQEFLEGHVGRIAALQEMIADVIYYHVERYQSGREHLSSAEEERNGISSFIRSFPPRIVETKETTCMGGVWLIAALLLRAGISPESLKYCHVNQLYIDDWNGKEGQGHGDIGPHGQLLLLLENKDVMVIDHGWHSCGRRLPLRMSTSVKTFHGMQDLLDGTKHDPVQFETNDDTSYKLKVPKSMIVMPLFDGFASEHLWHVGIEFLHERKLKEAERSFQMALSFCPKHPEALYYLGLTWSKMGDNESAKECFRKAIAIFPRHLRSHFALGEIALTEGDKEKAFEKFKRVVQDENPIWGDDSFKESAMKFYVKLKEDPLLPEWLRSDNEPLTYQI